MWRGPAAAPDDLRAQARQRRKLEHCRKQGLKSLGRRDLAAYKRQRAAAIKGLESQRQREERDRKRTAFAEDARATAAEDLAAGRDPARRYALSIHLA